MFTRPDEEQPAECGGDDNGELLAGAVGGSVPLRRILPDRAEAIELTDDELEDLAGGLMVDAKEPPGAKREA